MQAVTDPKVLCALLSVIYVQRLSGAKFEFFWSYNCRLLFDTE